MANPPKFTFGGPASTSGSSASSLFGSTTNNTSSGGGLFGNSTGNTPAPASTAPSLFGSKATSGAENKPLFGGAAGRSGFSFGGAASTGAGNASGGSGLFGSANTSNNNAPTASGFSFGNKDQPKTPGAAPTMAAPSTSASSQPTPATSSAPTGGLFGAATPAANKPSPLSFSTTPAGPPPSSTGNLFGGAGAGASTAPKPAAAPSSGGLFGPRPTDSTSATSQPSEAPTSSTGGLFGSIPKAGPSDRGLFGPAPADAAPTPPIQIGNTFGGKPAFNVPPMKNLFGSKPEDANKPKDLGLFAPHPERNNLPQSASDLGTPKPDEGNGVSMFDKYKPAEAGTSTQAGQEAAKPASGGLFGSVGKKPEETTKPIGQGFGLFGPPPASSGASSSTPPASTGAPGGLFGGALAQGKKDDAPKPATPAFSLGGNASASSAAAPAATTATSNADPKTPATTAPPAFSLGGTAKPAATGSTTAAAPAAAGDAARGSSNALGASTTGPPAPPTSRLANKSLDEILTLWTSSLTTHQKQFGALATKISGWDRMLVENSDKISKLYSRTFQAERDTSEVERQLSAVESQQQELEQWLDHYEKVVDELLTRSGGAESGVDAERERTYKTAERCSTRLTEISHDLTSMIEEINSASTSLSASSKSNKTEQQDPLAQIVRVLNSHLAQLQNIDMGAADLQTKVSEAMREVRALGRGADGDGGVDGFLRSLGASRR